MTDKTRALTTQGTQIAKAVTLQVLMAHVTDHWKRKTDEYGDGLYAQIAKAAGRKVAEEDDGYGGALRMHEYLKVSERELDGFIHRAALAYVHQQDEWLNTIITALNVDYPNEFVLTREYLDLYGKEQIVKLAKEARITVLTSEELAKKGRIIDAILRRAPKGFVPKDFQKAGRVNV
jgi:hypothetical protein